MFRELINLGRKEREREIARKYTAGAIVGTLVDLLLVFYWLQNLEKILEKILQMQLN